MVVVDDLDPVAGSEAEHVVAAHAEHGELAGCGSDGVGYAEDAGDAGFDGGVVARPLEGGGADGAGGVDLDAVVLVLHAGVAGVGGEAAGAGGGVGEWARWSTGRWSSRATGCRRWRR